MGSFPYNAGNAGDLLKHCFLADLVRAWSAYVNRTLVFFDHFAGLPWREPVNKSKLASQATVTISGV